MGVLRSILQAGGGLLVFAGCFFALQGAGVIMWPAESFMLANRQWITNGLQIAVVGAMALLLARKIPPA